MRLPNNFRIDNPSWAMVQAGIAYWGLTSAAGAAGGITLICADLDNHAPYLGHTIKILTGDSAGQEKSIQTHAVGGVITPDSAFTDAAGAGSIITAGTEFCIKGIGGGGGSPVGPSPDIGLWMFGRCNVGMAASTTILSMSNLAGFPDDIFNDEFYVQVIHNNNAVGVAPEHEIRLITDYDGATAAFTCDAFTANVEENDLVCVIHESLISPDLEVLSTIVQSVFEQVNSMLTLTETGGTLTTDGTVQNVYINNAPAGVFSPKMFKIDLTALAAGEIVVLRTHYRHYDGGGLILEEEVTFAGVQTEPSKSVPLDYNRFGLDVTLERTDGGAANDHRWEVFCKE